MSYIFKEKKQKITAILNNDAKIEQVKNIPDKGSDFTYPNGIKSWVGAIFIDLVDSTSLLNKLDLERKSIFTRTIKAFVGELIDILNDDENVRDIGIKGDSVYAMYTAPYQDDLIAIFRHAYCANTYVKMLNVLLAKKGYPQIKAGIGLGASEDIVIKADRDTICSDYVWIGDAVSNAAHLSKIANRRNVGPICMDGLFYSNIKERLESENKSYSQWITSNRSYGYDKEFYQCDIVQTSFSDWIDGGMKD